MSASQFMATRWSIVLAAGKMSGQRRQRALEELARAYWVPLYGYIRRKGHDASVAEDLVQGFFAHLLEKQALSKVDQELGRFRAFLLASLKNYMRDQWDKAKAIKRGGGKRVVELDAMLAEGCYRNEPVDDLTPERLFDRNWAMALLSQVMTRLGEEFEKKGQKPLFEAIQGSIAGSAEGLSYAQAGKKLGMSESAVKMAAHRLRKRYREILRDEIAQTVSGPELIDEEIRFLMNCL